MHEAPGLGQARLDEPVTCGIVDGHVMAEHVDDGCLGRNFRRRSLTEKVLSRERLRIRGRDPISCVRSVRRIRRIGGVDHPLDSPSGADVELLQNRRVFETPQGPRTIRCKSTALLIASFPIPSLQGNSHGNQFELRPSLGLLNAGVCLLRLTSEPTCHHDLCL